ncbi:nitronate monooxygenase [Aspergillus clavatus NRRL 1]|uniref:Oxidoreductase 2-nitropropane dioxygenase family, putative n=1 Tax=Aspergillus clavatus (strain ATCC 1007 / CBS 513.65 / DSM 816 / NCTC 3887 / NRRL 1 / QM 1276 / 107) TaxID=344612 RepID=A1CFR4_ASPCL|nr:oxidoreductase 2-nitropropane dioxygenase family, putative [Aspergillus clavatus NRRL 1]EAW11713.1 oxidoreductase 2-nitropropane dioxygenase family, putative [Aspergillus clavatus NRRL 1]
MSHIASTLTKVYPWVKPPIIVGAPMRVMSGAAMAVAISHAGGLGFIGPSPKTSEMATDLEEASSSITTLRGSAGAFQALRADGPLPVGVGFQLWNDDLETAVALIGKFKPCAAWLYAPRNGQSDLDEWSRRVRGASPQTRIWIQIGTVREARELLRGAERPDAVVIQGAEAGGHGRATDGMGLMSLFPEVADVLAASRLPLFAAGGIADGRGAAAALCLGAAGVALGTRFLAAREARISPGYQREVVRASDAAVSTTKTMLYNHLRGTTDWPPEYSPRAIINRSYVEYQQGRPFEELQKDFEAALKEGDQGWGPEGRLPAYAGASIGLVHEVKDAASIVHELQADVKKRISMVAV